jgi:hypothetical protein
MLPTMCIVTAEDAAAIRAALDAGGELAAVAEVRRRFLALANDERALEWARTIAGWTPWAAPMAPDRKRRGRHAGSPHYLLFTLRSRASMPPWNRPPAAFHRPGQSPGRPPAESRGRQADTGAAPSPDDSAVLLAPPVSQAPLAIALSASQPEQESDQGLTLLDRLIGRKKARGLQF